MLSSGDQEKVCELVDRIRDRTLVRPVVQIRRDQYGTVYLVPVDRSDNKLHTDLRTVLNDAAWNDENPPQSVLEDLIQLSCWSPGLEVEVSYE